jgi:hypothetical protein
MKPSTKKTNGAIINGADKTNLGGGNSRFRRSIKRHTVKGYVRLVINPAKNK